MARADEGSKRKREQTGSSSSSRHRRRQDDPRSNHDRRRRDDDGRDRRNYSHNDRNRARRSASPSSRGGRRHEHRERHRRRERSWSRGREVSPPPVAGPSRIRPEARREERRPMVDLDNAQIGDDFVPLPHMDEERARSRKGISRKRTAEEAGFEDTGYVGRQRYNSAFRRAPWALDVDWDSCENVSEWLHKDVEAYVRYISPTKVEHDCRRMIVELLAIHIKSAFPDVTVHPFGSFETGLYLPMGDIDLVLESRQMKNSNAKAVLYRLAEVLKRGNITNQVTVIAKAKVPIIKFITKAGNFSVDISINQINGVRAREMVKHFLQELPALQALVFVLKAFLDQREMNEVYTGGLGSYSIVLLSISFLQMHPKIRRGEIDPMENLGSLILDFFELYGVNFNYTQTGICISNGGSYYNKLDRMWGADKSGRSDLLSIEDPTDPNNDVSRNSFNMWQVRQTLEGAFRSMLTATYTRAASLAASKEQGAAPRVELDPEENSILALIMGVTEDTVQHRRNVAQLHESKYLQRLLGYNDRTPEVAHNHFSNHRTPSQYERKREIPVPQTVDRSNGATNDSDTRLHNGASSLRIRGAAASAKAVVHDAYGGQDEEEIDMLVSDASAPSEEEVGRYATIKGKAMRPRLSPPPIATYLDDFNSDEDDDDYLITRNAPATERYFQYVAGSDEEEVHLEDGELATPQIHVDDDPATAKVKAERNQAFWAAKAATGRYDPDSDYDG